MGALSVIPLLDTWSPQSVAILLVLAVYLIPTFISRLKKALAGQDVPSPAADFTAITEWLKSHDAQLQSLAKDAISPVMAQQLLTLLATRPPVRQPVAVPPAKPQPAPPVITINP